MLDLEIHFWKFVGEHDRRQADAQLRMTDAAVRLLDAHHFPRAKGVLVVFNGVRRFFHAEVRRRAAIFAWNRIDFADYKPSFGWSVATVSAAPFEILHGLLVLFRRAAA